mgnify:CR=1 FL=1|tara:strand:+ start:9741 stop:10307 length:567 start_codon:yes stop_codon:yes gene_type:complete
MNTNEQFGQSIGNDRGAISNAVLVVGIIIGAILSFLLVGTFKDTFQAPYTITQEVNPNGSYSIVDTNTVRENAERLSNHHKQKLELIAHLKSEIKTNNPGKIANANRLLSTWIRAEPIEMHVHIDLPDTMITTTIMDNTTKLVVYTNLVRYSSGVVCAEKNIAESKVLSLTKRDLRLQEIKDEIKNCK